MRKFIILNIILIVLGITAFGQEELLPLQIDPDLNNFYQDNQDAFKSRKLNEPMFLPFLEDFNQVSYKPDETLWIGENVFVNN